ncbi:MAG: hypothetical protein OEU54_10080 [Gemmatimonadota bacterium]|nr:hypothetical protein [Gemmatimonadota bacterium]
MRRPPFSPVVLALAACSQVDGSLPSATVTEGEDLTVVENRAPLWTGDDGWTLADEPSLVIGVLDGDAEYQLYGVRAARRRSDGGVVVLDASNVVRHYAEDGAFVGAYGGPGSGPGEFGAPTHLIVRPDDSMVVWDSRGFRLTHLDAMGRLVDTRTLDLAALANAVAPPLYPATGEPLRDGRVLVRLVGKDGKGTAGSADGVFRDRTGALIAAPDGTIDTLGFFADNEQSTLPALAIPVVPARAKRTELAASPAGDRICIGEQEAPEITCYGPGTSRLTFRWTAAPGPVTDADVAAWIDATAEAWGPKMSVSEAEKLLSEVVHPSMRPSHGEITIDDTGHIWVEPSRGPDGAPGGPSAVFDPNGVLLGEVGLPPIRVLEIGDDLLIGVHRDELEIEYVHVYELRKPPP